QIGNEEVDPESILEKLPPVAMNDLPEMPKMIRKKIRELTYGPDIYSSSGVSREKNARDSASAGSHRVQSVDRVAATLPPRVQPTRPTRKIPPAPKFTPPPTTQLPLIKSTIRGGRR
ncbi:hypothetical protein PFISCL1PPCAC_4963, partial [Pristionchus fissidentatus]